MHSGTELVISGEIGEISYSCVLKSAVKSQASSLTQHLAYSPVQLMEEVYRDSAADFDLSESLTGEH